MKVAICLPCYEDPKLGYAVSLARLTEETARVRPGIELVILPAQRLPIDMARTALVEKAIQAGADWLLFTDADHSFPAGALVRLLGHDRDIVGIDARMRRDSSRTIARDLDGKKLGPGRSGLIEVSSTGLAFCLIRATVFGTLTRVAKAKGESAYPLFAFRYEGSKMVMGEDGFFLTKCREAGIKTFVDADLSNEMGHIAETVLMI